MDNAGKYLGPHRQTGPGSYVIAPISIREYELSPVSFRINEPPRLGHGGFSLGSWGLTEGPHRGTSEGSGKLRPITPFIWDDLMQEHQVNQEYIDSEYIETFNKITETTIREIEQAKQAAKGARALSQPETTKIDQETTLNAIHSKASEYRANTETAYSLYGSNPFFLMRELSFRKLNESLNLNPPNILVAYEAIAKAYRSALELKRLSLGMHVLANQLPELSIKRSQADAGGQASREYSMSLVVERLSVVNQETNIRFQLLPSFLVDRIVAAAGLKEGRTLSQTLARYKLVTDKIIAAEQAAIRPYVMANPHINSPLSKPELEALKNLVNLQAKTKLGKRWQDYHVSLLHSEVVRYLAETTNAFSGLIVRAQEAENVQKQLRIAAAQEIRRLQEQARIAAKAEVRRVAAEQARVAAEARRVAAKQARIAAKAEAKRIADEQARAVTEAIRTANMFRAPGYASAAGPLFMTSAGTVAVIEVAASVTLQGAIRAAITALGGLVASVGAAAVVGVSALFYSSKLDNGELPERYAFSTPLSDLIPDIGQDLNVVAAAGGTVDLPYRVSSKTAADGQSELFVVKADGLNVPSKVRVVAATYNSEQNVYTATTADVPPRTLTWTPIVNPGNSSTTSPAEQPAPPVYTGATVTPVEGRIDTFPSVSEASFDDFITVFPMDSGLPPVYTMFRDRREDPGVATGVGQPVSGIWLGAASQGEGAPVPSQIADQLRGREFKSFRAFRETFWKAVANDPELARQFNKQNLVEMAKGNAPFAPEREWAGKTGRFELHHKVYISNNGSVYDIENMTLVTPKRHKAIHREKK